jgi:signal transduction histidine kinase/PAS domain-containing protein
MSVNEVTPQTLPYYEQRVITLEAELAQLRQEQEPLRKRDRLLSTIAQVANLLLRSQDYQSALPTVVRLLGEAAGSDRCGIGQNVTHPILDKPAIRIAPDWEWCKNEVLSSEEFSPHLDRLFLWEIDAPYIDSKLSQGEVINCFVTDLPEPDRSLLAAQGNIAELFVPIWVDYKNWGYIAFDNCSNQQLYDEAEIAILKIVADSIAAAIERQAQDEALQKSEAMYRSLFDISNEGIYRWKLDQPISIHLPIEEQVGQIYQNYYCAQANDAYARMMGLTKGEDSVGLRLSDIHIEESQKNQDFVRSFISSGYSIRNAESEEIDVSGCKRYFLNGVMSFIENDRVTGGWGTQIDITELREAQQALLKTEQERVAELAKANEVLKRSLDALSSDPNLDRFLGEVLKVIAQELDAPVVEYWQHNADNIATLNLSCCYGQLLTPDQQVNDPRIQGVKIPPELTQHDTLHGRQEIVIVEDLLSQLQRSVFDPIGFDLVAWGTKYGVGKYMQFPLILGEQSIGTLCIYIPRDRAFTKQQIELGRALAQQATLAIHLTQLAEEAQQAALFEERNRLAGEIHDTLAQTFTGITVQLELANYLIQSHSTEINSILDRIGKLAQTGLKEARRSVWSVYPDSEDYADLAQKLSECVEHLTHGTPLHTQVHLQGEPYPLSCFIGKNLLRIGQEAIANTLKHAQATEIRIELTYSPDRVSLCVKDNGCGFHPQAQTEGFGLISISERTDRMGGHLQITTQPNRGTEIFVQVTP